MLRDELSGSLKEAMKAKDEQKVSTLRLILAALKDRDIAARGKGQSEPVSETEILEMLTKMIRQRRDSIKMYEEGGRVDLAEREQGEIDVIETFLPKQLTEDEIRDAAKAVIAELGAAGLKDMGRTMSEMKQRYAGQMDPGKASTVVKALLT
ncbi:MAG: GatB/YqeY domain-containing protein [Minwuiales bacterium]|nr:GatB/YqeY domain-containing protein [Minwuiales bacterium]